MGDARRFEVLADFVAEKFSRDMRVADVGAGKGLLTVALRKLGFVVTAIEPNPRRNAATGVLKRLWKREMAVEYDLVVGMHPDGATQGIVRSVQWSAFAVVPCCAIAETDVYWGPKAGGDPWMRHLESLAVKHGARTNKTKLKMSGKNTVLWSRGA